MKIQTPFENVGGLLAVLSLLGIIVLSLLNKRIPDILPTVLISSGFVYVGARNYNAADWFRGQQDNKKNGNGQ